MNPNIITQHTWVVIGSRKSRLAQIQAHLFQEALKKYHPKIKSIIKTIQSIGDQDLNRPLSPYHEKENNEEVPYKHDQGIFTSLLEDALINQEIDVAVHSWKDVPIETDERLQIAGVLPRAHIGDVIFSHTRTHNFPFKEPPCLLTASLRRQALARIAQGKPIHTELIRGNVETRIRKWQQENKNTILMIAQAGLDRLNIPYPKASVCSPKNGWLPAPAQGIIALQIRRDNEILYRHINTLSSQNAYQHGSVERSILKGLGGGCSLPLGVFSSENGIQAILAHPQDKKHVKIHAIGDDAHTRIIDELNDKGHDIIKSLTINSSD